MKRGRLTLLVLIALWLPLQSLALSLLPCEQLLHGDTESALLECHGDVAAAPTADRDGIDCVHCDGLCRNPPNLLLSDDGEQAPRLTASLPANMLSVAALVELDRLRRPPRHDF